MAGTGGAGRGASGELQIHLDGNVYDVALVFVNLLLRSWLGICLFVAAVAVATWAGLAGQLDAWVAVPSLLVLVGLGCLVASILYPFLWAPKGWRGGLLIQADERGLHAMPMGHGSSAGPSSWRWSEVAGQREVQGHRLISMADGTKLVIPRKAAPEALSRLLSEQAP